ncbi:hypothetical protein HZI73_05120 [Vallitalea pronyensis]|uniref:Peptidase C1A papain C-terminal domain-containing protein n=1 Tax=Vallitalea pronyensis TaxID=1348613 RepID=A0A8J8MI90_9FIRM|nr:lectin like domain-containing protein [Vallitalea pronyensis]QUI21713.1 hypothetical protein HZI73_05120 [Vallitalea pronyensis]
MKLNQYIRNLVVSMIVIVCFIPSTVSATETAVAVSLDNVYIAYNDEYGKPYIDENNRTMVPLRLTLEQYGAEVYWDGEAGLVSIMHGGITVHVPIGENYIYRNGKKIDNDTQAVIVNKRTYLPIRVVMEAFGCEVIWDGHNREVVIYTRDYDAGDSRYDLREEGNVTSVKNQGDLGTCWAFAALGAMESTLLTRTGEHFDFSEDNMSLGHGYNLTQDEGGDFMLALAYFARWSGPIYERDDEYGDGQSPENTKSVKHLQEAFFLPSKDKNMIKDTVKAYGGLHTSIYWDFTDDIHHSPYYNQDTYAYFYNGTKTINHDVVIVGWDDNYPKENFKIQPKENGAFICKNSFGIDFGEEGYFYMSYEDVYIGSQTMVYSGIEEPDNYDKIYQSDWLGLVGNIGFNTDTAYFSNAYTTGDNQEALAAVSFYTTGMHSKYEVYVVEDFKGKPDFSRMVAVEKGFKEFKGYYTIPLSKPITLKKNQKFAVVVKITTPGSKFPIAAEFNRDVKWIDQVDIEDGEGYMSYDGEKWDDTEDILQSNVCLKAFTKIIQDDKVEPNNPNYIESLPEEQENVDIQEFNESDNGPSDSPSPIQNSQEEQPVKTTPADETKPVSSPDIILDKDAIHHKDKKLLGLT